MRVLRREVGGARDGGDARLSHLERKNRAAVITEENLSFFFSSSISSRCLRPCRKACGLGNSREYWARSAERGGHRLVIYPFSNVAESAMGGASFPHEVPREVDRAAKKLLRERNRNSQHAYAPEEVYEKIKVSCAGVSCVTEPTSRLHSPRLFPPHRFVPRAYSRVQLRYGNEVKCSRRSFIKWMEIEGLSGAVQSSSAAWK